MAKKKKYPKYIQEKFNKPQFKVGDFVQYEFLGDHGWGYVTKIQKINETISYMVQGNNYTYPCGLKIKEHSSYYAGSIDYEASKNPKHNESTRSTTIEKRIDNKSRKRLSGNDNDTISDTGTGHSSETNIRTSNADDSTKNSRSTTKLKNTELEQAIDRQKDFLRKFT
tara:strand:+ start:71 stop:574 length:504 start_codon:yes stop_codon:yes gene_type:complete